VSTAKLTIIIQGSNEAPVNTVPTSAVTTQEGSAYSFISTVSSSDVDENLASVTLSVEHGTISVSNLGSIVYSEPEGGISVAVGVQLVGGAIIYFNTEGTTESPLTDNGTKTFTLYGTQAQINDALATLVYTPDAGFVGADTLTIQSIDNESLKDIDTVEINVTAAPLSVSSPIVNEASPYTVFSVDGLEGQLVKLSLGNTSSTSDVDAALGTDISLVLEYYNGTSWVTYDPNINGGYISIPSDGDATSGEAAILFVRVANNNDTSYEIAETFTLIVINTSNTSVIGTATIVDDGSGDVFLSNSTTAPATPTELSTAGVVLDDDRPLTVSSVTINEGSPYAVFTVTGIEGQIATLALSGQNADGANLTGLEYFDVATSSWLPYSSSVTLPTVGAGLSGETSSLLVRVAINPEQDTVVDGPEVFNLVATNTGGASATGVGVIVDDGTGSYFAADNNTATSSVPGGVILDDDRLLTVSNITVNEASPYATFTVSGVAGQLTTLSLLPGTTTSATGEGTDYGDGTSPTDSDLEYWTGSTWQIYTAGSTVALDANGELLVRTVILNDSTADNGETFRLQATNTGMTSVSGTAIIKDDGTGDVFAYIGTASATPLKPTDAGYPVLDDDRALTVSSVTVNEGSPYAVFTVTGNSGQTVSLSVTNADGSPAGEANLGGSPALQYFENGTWKTYDPTNPPEIADGATTLLVRVALSAEQDSILDGPETFNLVATNTGGISSPLTQGVATIKDDGTGDYFAATNNTSTSNVPAGVALDDDRPLSVGDVSVNEGSPYAVFTVTGSAGQLTSLALAGQNADGSNLASIEYFDGTQWTAYTGGNVSLVTDGMAGQLLVRIALSPEQDLLEDGPETFSLVATNTGGATDSGQATILDNGSGDYYAVDNITGASQLPSGVLLDDDRSLTVSSPEVNEASPYATFSVTGVAGQYVRLSLGNTSSSIDSDALLYTDTGDAGTGVPLQYFNGTSWVDYTPDSFVQIPDGGSTLLVRTAIINDTLVEGAETFTLTATNTGGNGAIGTATIKDDGSGGVFKYSSVDSSTPLASSDPSYPILDDDRPLAVSSTTVNEASPYAVFTITGAAGQKVTLVLPGIAPDTATDDGVDFGSGSAGSDLQYWDSTENIWQPYTTDSLVTLNSNGTLLVRTAIIDDDIADNNETFRLHAVNTGGVIAAGLATIKDDGTGTVFDDAGNPDPNAERDVDITVTSPLVNEASPYAVFTVTASLGQQLTLTLAATTATSGGVDFGADVSETSLGSTSLEFSLDGGVTWVISNGLFSNDLTGTGLTSGLLVRTPISQDAISDNGEQFTLKATPLGGLGVTGVATISDVGTGTIFNANGSDNNLAVKDDDRALTVSSPVVNEAS